MIYYHTPAATASDLSPAPLVYDTFRAVRPRRDGWGAQRSRGAETVPSAG